MTPGPTLSVSVHIGSFNVWSAAGQREFCCRVDVERDSPTQLPPVVVNPLDFIDDDYIDISGRITAVGVELVQLILQAVQGCGLADADVLYLSYPTEWGRTRKRRLLDAARRVGYDIVLVPAAVAIARSTHGNWRVRCIVVEIRAGDAVVSCVRDFDGDVTVMSTRRATLAELPAVFTEFGELTVRDSVVVVGRHAHSVASSLEGGSRSIHGYASVRVLDESRIVRSIVDPRVRLESVTAESLAGRAVDNSAFGDRWVVPAQPGTTVVPSGHAHRWRLAAGVVVVAVLAVAAGVATGRSTVEGTAVEARIMGAQAVGTYTVDESQAGIPAVTTVPTVTSPSTVPSAALQVGQVSLEFPVGWTPDTGEAPAGRTDVIPPAGRDRKIVVVEKELRAGVDFDDVVAVLREQSTALENPLRFGNFEPVVADDGRNILLYREFPDVYSEVRWHVFVERGMQVSIGCQYLVGDWDAFAAECGQIIESLTYEF